MSVRQVASRDLTSVLRSRGLWAAATLLALLVALGSFGIGFPLSSTESVQRLFVTLAGPTRVLLPLVAIVASYQAIVGERTSGGIKFLLGFPNTRLDVFAGKLLSRLAVVTGIVGFVFLSAASVAATTEGTLPLGTVFGIFVVTLVYAWVFVAIALALSAGIATRGRAIAAAFGSYFVLVLLYAVPVFRITTVVAWIHRSVLGFDHNQTLYDAVSYSSPYVAYQKAINLVVPADMQTEIFRRSSETAPDLPVYLTDGFSVVVFGVWLVGSLAVGYLRFERADID